MKNYIMIIILIITTINLSGKSEVLKIEKSVGSGITFVENNIQKQLMSYKNLPRVQVLINGNSKTTKQSYDYGNSWSKTKEFKLNSFIISHTGLINEILNYNKKDYNIIDIYGTELNKNPNELSAGIYLFINKKQNTISKIMVTQ